MGSLDFELRPFRREKGKFSRKGVRGGRTGSVNGFGDVTVEHGGTVGYWRGRPLGQVLLHGDGVPSCVFTGVTLGIPSLEHASLKVGDTHVEMRVRHGILPKNQPLLLKCRGVEYRYTIDVSKREAQLARDGMSIHMRRIERSDEGIPVTIGSIVGVPQPEDVSLALVFEEVDTFDLTTVGSIASIPRRLTSRLPNETPSE